MFLSLSLAAALTGAQPVPANHPMSDQFAVRLLVPAYVYPSTDTKTTEGQFWGAILKAAGPKCPVVAIINPNSGPTDAKGDIDNYRKLLAAAKGNKHLWFAMYVPLARQQVANGDHAVNAERATADVNLWLKHFPPKEYPNMVGFFFDEHPATDKNQLAAAQKVRDHARKQFPSGTTFVNPGRHDGAPVLTIDKPNEVAVLWEKAAEANVRDNFALPAWADEKANGAPAFPRRRFAVLVHTKEALQDDFVPLLNEPQPKGKRVGWVYVTDDSGANPWDRLPKYWAELVKSVEKQNGKK